MQLLWIVSMVAAMASASPAQTAAPAQAKAKAPAAAAAKKPAAAGRTIEITGGDDMKYSVTSIQAKPGETLHIVLKSTGTVPKIAMAHNFVALKAGTDPVEFNKAAAMARETDFIPAAMKTSILASTALAGPGETVEVTLKAPAKAGTYPYMCTFPGHYAAGMKGELTVK
jgi:azurin